MELSSIILSIIPHGVVLVQCTRNTVRIQLPLTEQQCFKIAHISTLMGHHGALYKYRVIRNDCRGFNNLSYTIHLR